MISPEAGRNDHIHGDEHFTEYEEFRVTVTVIKQIVISIMATEQIKALECAQEAMRHEMYVEMIDDAEISNVTYEVSE